MIKQNKDIINEVFPKIEKHYGFSKFQECTPFHKTLRKIYVQGRLD